MCRYTKASGSNALDGYGFSGFGKYLDLDGRAESSEKAGFGISLPGRVLTLCPQLCMGTQPGARFPAQSADALPVKRYGHFTSAIYRNRPIVLTLHPPHSVLVLARSYSTRCTGARHVIGNMVCRCSPCHPPHSVPVLAATLNTY